MTSPALPNSLLRPTLFSPRTACLLCANSDALVLCPAPFTARIPPPALGRVAWGTISDRIGTTRAFSILWGLGVPLYLAMPFAAHLIPSLAALPGPAALLPLGLFYASVMLAITTFGGSAAVIPAYISDLFGPKYVGAIHGQILSFLVVAGYLGPVLSSYLRGLASRDAMHQLAALIDPAVFAKVFPALLSPPLFEPSSPSPPNHPIHRLCSSPPQLLLLLLPPHPLLLLTADVRRIHHLAGRADPDADGDHRAPARALPGRHRGSHPFPLRQDPSRNGEPPVHRPRLQPPRAARAQGQV